VPGAVSTFYFRIDVNGQITAYDRATPRIAEAPSTLLPGIDVGVERGGRTGRRHLDEVVGRFWRKAGGVPNRRPKIGKSRARRSMERIQYFLWLGKMATEALAFFWWLTLPALGVLVGSLLALSSRGLAGFRAHHWSILLFGIFPLALLALGAGFAQAGEGALALKIVYGILLTHLLLAGYCAWRGRRGPWFFLALSALLVVCSLASGMVAGMAITDVWL
jgi:hypothetical protein